MYKPDEEGAIADTLHISCRRYIALYYFFSATPLILASALMILSYTQSILQIYVKDSSF